MINKVIFNTFKRGSRTYFYSSIFFPEDIKKDVFSLYAYVRKADDFVDSIPQQKDEFYIFKEKTLNALKGTVSHDPIIDSFAHLAKKNHLEEIIGNNFLSAMESDLYKTTYRTLEETEKYMYGSAEVIGLAMAHILKLDEKSYQYAQMLGKAMQYANFIRDINEDLTLGRVYFPLKDLTQFQLTSLEKSSAESNPAKFNNFINLQISRFEKWQELAEKGFAYIPKRYRVPIKTASDMYKWTIQKIKDDPFIIYRKKVKPSITRIVKSIAENAISC